MTLLCYLIRTFAMLLFMAFGVSAAFAAQGDGTPISYFVVVQELEVQPAKLAPTARAPPTNRVVLTNTSGAFAQTDKLRMFYDVASFGDASAIWGYPIATNRTVTDFVDGVTVVDRRTGTTFIANEGLTRDIAEDLLQKGYADAAAFGRDFIATPDLPERFRKNLPLNEANPATFYAGGAEGYTDYPVAEE